MRETDIGPDAGCPIYLGARDTEAANSGKTAQLREERSASIWFATNLQKNAPSYGDTAMGAGDPPVRVDAIPDRHSVSGVGG